MTRQEELEVVMQGRIAIILDKYKSKFAGYDRLISEINTFNGYRISIVPMIAQQSEVTTGVTADKLNSLNDLGKQLGKIGVKASVYANDNNNQALAAIFNITATSFRNLSQSKKLIVAQGFLDALEANAAGLAANKISSDDIKAISDSISNCRRQVLASTDNSKVATKAIKKLFKLINASLAIIDGLISSEYGDTDPDFVSEYFINRQIKAQGVRHTGITVTFTDAATGNAIEGATVGIASLGKTAVSNINGVATIPKMKTGTYHVDFSASGYTAQMQDVIVPRSRKVDIAMVLVAVV